MSERYVAMVRDLPEESFLTDVEIRDRDSSTTFKAIIRKLVLVCLASTAGEDGVQTIGVGILDHRSFVGPEGLITLLDRLQDLRLITYCQLSDRKLHVEMFSR